MRKSGDMIRDQVRILYLLFLNTFALVLVHVWQMLSLA
jgi:hypothetical protein